MSDSQRSGAPTDPNARAVLGASTFVRGELLGEEDLTVLGRVEGKIKLEKHTVTVGKTARIAGDIVAARITVEGEVTGSLTASESVVVRASGNVTGDIRAPRMAVEDGSKVKGTVDMPPKP